MTLDNVVSIAFVLVMLAAIIFRGAYRMFHEAQQLVGDERSGYCRQSFPHITVINVVQGMRKRSVTFWIESIA